MGPVDLVDQTNKHGTLVKSRKYWKVLVARSLPPRNISNIQVLFHWCIDVAVTNSWRVYQVVEPRVNRREFLMLLIASLSQHDGSTRYVPHTLPRCWLTLRSLKRSRSVSATFVRVDKRRKASSAAGGDFRSKPLQNKAIFVAKKPGSHLPKSAAARNRCRVCRANCYSVCSHCTNVLQASVHLCTGKKNCF